SFKEWVEAPEIEVGHRVALDLLRIVREVMPVLQQDRELGAAIQTLGDAKISKTRAMLPLLSEGFDEEFIDLIDRAPQMTLRDVNREVRALRKGEGDDEEMPAVFKAKVKR